MSALLATLPIVALTAVVPAPAVRAAAPPSAFGNPAVWQDFADLDIIRVGEVYYASASTMHYSPGVPILRSYDLVNWEFAGHSVPRLDFGAKYDLNGGRGYVRGIWASTLNYRPRNRTYYWAGCIDFSQTHVYTATAPDAGARPDNLDRRRLAAAHHGQRHLGRELPPTRPAMDPGPSDDRHGHVHRWHAGTAVRVEPQPGHQQIQRRQRAAITHRHGDRRPPQRPQHAHKATRVVLTDSLTMDSNWNTTGTGREVAGAAVAGGRIWLRASADIRPGAGRQGRFSYSTDGVTFSPLGGAPTLDNSWQFFMGYRFGIFNYATQALGGSVTVNRLAITTP